MKQKPPKQMEKASRLLTVKNVYKKNEKHEKKIRTKEKKDEGVKVPTGKTLLH